MNSGTTNPSIEGATGRNTWREPGGSFGRHCQTTITSKCGEDDARDGNITVKFVRDTFGGTLVTTTGEEIGSEDVELEAVRRWCRSKGEDWVLTRRLGRGGTASVYEVKSPEGIFAFKLYDQKFSLGALGEIEEIRIKQQLALNGHGCPFLINVFEGGRFEERLFLLMDRPNGCDLKEKLNIIPRDKIRTIIDQIAKAVLFLNSKGLCHRDIKSSNVMISDDFSRAILMDLGVTRSIYDPVGVGTDQDGGLPVVATARYCPPEYLFRLVDPGPDLWHALDVYQLGALLHDLIMRKSLFSDIDKDRKTNKYRFAWLIATTSPEIDATDVDGDLIFLAQRALSKDLKIRLDIKIEEFQLGGAEDAERALAAIGLGGASRSVIQPMDSIRGKWHNRFAEISDPICYGILGELSSRGRRATHTIKKNDVDLSASITFTWISDAIGKSNISFVISYSMRELMSNLVLDVNFELKADTAGDIVVVVMPMDAMQDGEDLVARVLAAAKEALGALAKKIVRARS